jgi:hypothetical protein
LAFLDEDELDPATEPGAHRYGADRQRQILVRRVFALGVGVLILILLLLGIRGCLNARKERGFENYVSDLSSIVSQANQLSTEFFDRLENPPKNLTELSLQAEVASNRGTAEGLLQRVEGLDTPDELKGAQDELIQAFELRRDALAGIAENIPTALGDTGRQDATEAIASDMRVFLASDVLFARARGEIQGVLEDEGITGKVPASQFLPDPPDPWLDDLELTTTLAGIAGDSGAASGVHGLELLGTTVNPGGVALVADSPNTVQLGGRTELDIDVQNGGDSEESDVVVSYRLSGGSETLEGEATIPRVSAGGVETATLAFEGDPETDTELTLEVTVVPVPGETLTDNNAATYSVTFE